ncbi:MAG: isoprenylcysteine carboxylmethyltransferase family protein [Gammaproteobacteria bacterium]|nr:isoprenylcysteine carboxylmethyltransferase family protein [Gammaproteobacteria bacterium]
MRLILWLWSGWGLYWLLSALRNKATQRRESIGSRLAHLVPLAIGGALIAWQPPSGSFASRVWIGGVLTAAGLAFAVWARVHLGRNWSGTVTIKQDHELIRSGPYGYVRHPIYTGLLTALLGTTIAAGTVQGVVGLVIIACALVRKSRIEEGFMRESFPAEYPRYSAEVPALIPFTRGSGGRGDGSEGGGTA